MGRMADLSQGLLRPNGTAMERGRRLLSLLNGARFREVAYLRLTNKAPNRFRVSSPDSNSHLLSTGGVPCARILAGVADPLRNSPHETRISFQVLFAHGSSFHCTAVRIPE